MPKLLLIVLVAVSLQGCAGLLRDRRDAPWDPPPGRSLFEQIPNPVKGGRCCGSELRCEAHQTPRC